MESQQGVFKSRGENETYADVKDAIAIIDAVLATTFDKSIFRDMLTGFKILIKSLQQKKENEAASICDILLKWLKLYLRTQNTIDASDVKLQQQFEKFVPASISYIIAALQYIPKDSALYHFQMLDLLLKLLDNVTESTLKTVANLESGLILFLWRPIANVGDFNTQMMAFRILVKLLKCLDDSKQCEILKSLQESNLQESIYSAVRVYNFPAGKFEKIARNVLNHYNMNLAQNNVLVYSMRCKSVIFGNGATLYKNLHEDQLWLDLNYSPRTLTFKSRYRPNKKTGYINIGVTLHIAKFSLNENILSSVLEAPPQFTKTTSQLDKLKALREVQFVLPDEESLRLKENQCVIDYYNAASSRNKNFESQENTPSGTSTSDEDHLRLPFDNANVSCTPKEAFILTPPKPQNNASKKTSDNFQKSYDLLIALSGNSERNTNNTEIAAGDEISNMKLEIASLQNKNNAIVINDSPKTSHPLEDEMKVVTEKVEHPIAELSCPKNNRRRFFKRKSDSSDDTNQCTKKCKTKTNMVKRKRAKKIVTSPPKRKQVNKVKPMNHLAKDNGDPEEAAQEYVENGGIVNITNFLRNGNESAAVFNDDEKRIILKNVNRISDGLERTAKRFFRRNESATVSQMANSTINGNIYEESESEAEPGRSYRNFTTSRSEQEKPKQKRTRKNVNALKSITEKTKNQIARDDDSVPSTSRAAAVRILQNKRKRAAKSSAAASPVTNTIATDNHPSKVSKLESKKSEDKTPLVANTIATDKHPHKVSKLESKKSQDKTMLSTDIEIDLTLKTDNDGIENNLTANLSDTKRISQAVEEKSNAEANSSVTFFKRIFQQTQFSNSSSPSLSSVEDNNNYNDKQNEVGQQSPVVNINNNTEEFKEIQDCRDDYVIDIIAINDMLSSPIGIIANKNCSPAFSDVIDEPPQNTTAVLHSNNKENESADIRSNQNETNKANFYEKSFRKISPIKKTASKQTMNFNRRESVRLSQEIVNDCILYRSRSETESSDESDKESSSVDHEAKFFKQPFKTPTKFTVERTSKKSISRATRNSISMTQPTCKVTTSITHKVMDVFIVPRTTEVDESNLNDDLSMEINGLTNDSSAISKFPVVDAATSNCITQYVNDLDVTQHQITKDVSQLLWTFQENIVSKFDDVHKESNSQRNTLDMLMKKIIDLGERMIIETEKQRLEMEESQIEIDKILCRLNWHWDVLQAKTERFHYFKENMEQFLDTATSINIEEEINNEFGQNLSTIQEHGSKIRKKQWTEYVDSFTKNLLQNVSRLSAL